MRNVKEANTPFAYICTRCGKSEDLRNYRVFIDDLQKMMHNQICYDCAYWERISQNPPANYIVCDGELMVVSFDQTSPFKVLLHAYKYIVTFDGKPMRVNSITSYGRIPEYLKDKFPTNATFINKHQYSQFKDAEGHVCMKRGCYDRYHCFCYHPEIAEPDGPWNKIPEGYQPGWECCPLFINKHEIFKK